jgi:hypothetical protein
VLVIFGKHIQGALGLECLGGNAGQEFFGDSATINTRLHGPELINEADLDRLLETIAQLVELGQRIIKYMLSPDLCLMTSQDLLKRWVPIRHLPCTPRVGLDISVSAAMLVVINKLAENLNTGGKGNEERHISQDFKSGCDSRKDPTSSHSLLMTPQRFQSDSLLGMTSPGEPIRRVRPIIHRVSFIWVFHPSLDLMSPLLFTNNSGDEPFHIKPAGHKPVIWGKEIAS